MPTQLGRDVSGPIAVILVEGFESPERQQVVPLDVDFHVVRNAVPPQQLTGIDDWHVNLRRGMSGGFDAVLEIRICGVPARARLKHVEWGRFRFGVRKEPVDYLEPSL